MWLVAIAFAAAHDLAVAAHAPPATTAAEAAAPFAVPATFARVLPCADCAGIAHTLTLRADGLYFSRQTPLGNPGGSVSQAGGWDFNDEAARLTLYRGTGRQHFAFRNGELLQLDSNDQAIVSRMNPALRRAAQVDAGSDIVRWHGKFRYVAGSTYFLNCDTGALGWPVAEQADYAALVDSYNHARSEPGAPLMVTFDGHLAVFHAADGPALEQMVVDRFVAVHPNTSCP